MGREGRDTWGDGEEGKLRGRWYKGGETGEGKEIWGEGRRDAGGDG